MQLWDCAHVSRVCGLTCSSGLCHRWSASRPAWPAAARISHNPPGPRSSSADLRTTFKQKNKKIKSSSACLSSRIRMLMAVAAPPVGMRMLMSDSVDRLLPQVKNPLVTWTQSKKKNQSSQRCDVPQCCSGCDVSGVEGRTTTDWLNIRETQSIAWPRS